MELLTAYHEAGHAVMGNLVGLEIIELSIIPDEAQSKLGCCHHSIYDDFHPEYFSDAETPVKTKNIILLLVAGAVSEEILTGTWDNGADLDLQRANYLALLMASNDDEIKEIFNNRWREAYALIEQNWETVEKLAFKLVETKQLKWEQIKTIINRE